MNGGNQNSFIYVSDSYWPIFFSKELRMRFIGQTTCYAFTDIKSKMQIVVVYPERGCFNFPTPYEIAENFPMDGQGEIIKPAGLPLHELRSSTGVFFDDCGKSLFISDRHLLILQATWEKEEELQKEGREIVITDLILYGFELAADEADKLHAQSENHALIHKEFLNEKVRIIVLLRNSKPVKLSENVTIRMLEDGDLFIDIANKKKQSAPALSDYDYN